MKITLYFHPSWSKTEPARSLLSGTLFGERDLENDKLTVNEVQFIKEKVEIEAAELIRQSSPYYNESMLNMNDEDIYHILSEEPTLIKRPILQVENTFIVGLDEEKWIQLINKMKPESW